MPESNAYHKRVKRHVIARRHPFFCVVTPGLEPWCQKEMGRPPLELTDAAPQAGGIEWAGRLTDMYRANLYLRTANRILMRICRFKATNFQQLARSVLRQPWELFVKPGGVPRVTVSTRHSRLFHKKAVAEHLLTGIQSRFEREEHRDLPAASTDVRQTIFVRIVDDHFLVSLDSSGDLLHRRGVKAHPASAPLRETLAAALLMMAGYRPDQPLIDPMCGSGTFCLEAAMQAADIAAGSHRSFAFFDWPAFRPPAWRHIKKQSEERMRSPNERVIFASDSDQTACRRLEETVASQGWQHLIEVRHRDFFEGSPDEYTGRPGLVVINPPYGRRLTHTGPSAHLFERICHKLNADYSGWKVGLVVPRKEWLSGLPARWHRLPVHHGGLRVWLVAGRIP